MSAWLRIRTVADRVVAALLSVVSAPFVAVLAVLIRHSDGGVPLVRVPRSGRDGAVFGMWKLRSMRVDTVDGRAAGSGLTLAEDDRITPIGKRLRSLHLDEIPQLYNVARGEMSLLGPRPETPEYVDLDDPAWVEVLSTVPGIAGPTQLIVGDWERSLIEDDGQAYRSTVLPVKLAIDAWYLQSATPVLDLQILAALAGQTLGREPRSLRNRVFRDVPGVANAVQDQPQGASR